MKNNFFDLSMGHPSVIKDKRNKINNGAAITGVIFIINIIVPWIIIEIFPECPSIFFYMILWTCIIFLIIFIALVTKREIYSIAILLREIEERNKK